MHAYFYTPLNRNIPLSEPNSQHILKNIAKFRRLALGSAVFIAILSAVMVFKFTSVLDSTSATKINLAGKQRMLAQRLLTESLLIDASVKTGDWDALPKVHTQLAETITRLEEDHRALFANLKAPTSPDSPFTPEQEAYQSIVLPFQSMIAAAVELNKLTASMIRRSPYIDDQTITRVTASKNEITQAHAYYLPKMETIVTIYEQEYKSKISKSTHQAKLGLIALFVILGANLLFVVEPTILLIRRQLRELDKATRRAKRADAIRWRLLTNMGHEFRTPMTAIMGFADLLDEESITDNERARLTKSIYNSSTQLTHLIETMLDMSAIESGQLRIVDDSCNLHQTLEKLRDDASTLALAKNLELTLTIDDSCPSQITTDQKRLQQILYNLIDNAIKFTSEGKVEIKTSFDNTSNTIAFAITDTGIGINQRDQQSIFDPFIQAEDNVTRSFGGAGLGLSVAKELAKALQGDITLDSTPDQGSTFTLTINPGQVEYNNPNDATPITQQDDTLLAHSKVLIVDDAKDNRILLKHILKKTGAQIEFAHDGQEAIDAIELAIESNEPYDLILMDMQMPVLDGYHATVQLRENGITTPIIALTAHALDGDRDHCINAGCDEYMTKPIDKAALIETCSQLLAKEDTTDFEIKKAA